MSAEQSEYYRTLVAAGFKRCSKKGCANLAFVDGKCGQHMGKQ